MPTIATVAVVRRPNPTRMEGAGSRGPGSITRAAVQMRAANRVNAVKNVGFTRAVSHQPERR
jgi:hypothetical protein